MPVTMKSKPHELVPTIKTDLLAEVDGCIRQKLAECPYEFYFNKVTWQFEDGRLTLNGCVRTFYMKQTLQTILRHIENVEHLVNDVDVVSTTGLSSIRPK